MKQAIFSWSINQNLNKNLNKSIEILIGTWTNQLDPSQNTNRTINILYNHSTDEVNEHKVDGIMYFFFEREVGAILVIIKKQLKAVEICYWYYEAHQSCARRPSTQGTLPVGRPWLAEMFREISPAIERLAVRHPPQHPRTLSSSPKPNLLARHRAASSDPLTTLYKWAPAPPVAIASYQAKTHQQEHKASGSFDPRIALRP